MQVYSTIPKHALDSYSIAYNSAEYLSVGEFFPILKLVLNELFAETLTKLNVKEIYRGYNYMYSSPWHHIIV